MDAWWKSAVIYQVYPRSFQDSDGDGTGDLNGIRARLPYLAGLGVDALWLSPVFVSPMADFGYDIADYTAIDPLFGTLADFDALLADAHGRGLKLLLDLVPNHTSIEHPWFRESRASRDNPKRDWYIWRDGRAGGPPNNWVSEFGGPSWTFDKRTGQFYYHAFLSAQPDLNWRNPEVKNAIANVMRFWLDRGVDGFRVDALWHVIKDEALRDNPLDPNFRAGDPPHDRFLKLYSGDRPEAHDVIRIMRGVIDEYSDRLLIGELYLPLERLVAYYGDAIGGLHLPFNFSLIKMPWHAREIAALIDRYEALLPPGAWPNWVLGNHDKPRIASRIGEAQARVAAVLLLTLRGTPTLYYGDEIGMAQVAIAPEQVRDPFEKNVPGFGLGRDGCRTPMQWDSSPNAGFSSASPWLPLTPDATTRNVAQQDRDPSSLLSFYRRLLSLRRAHPALSVGSYRSVPAGGDILAYIREYGAERFLIALNLSGAAGSLPLPEELAGTVVLATSPQREGRSIARETALAGNEGLVIRLD